MKYNLIISLLFFSFSLFSQQKGVTPLKTQNSSLTTGSTYAVVVGISDYQDEGIPDLRFADKDALAFAGFLQSPAGGSLDEDHLKVLINQQATVAQFAIALDWLWEVVKENDRVIIYFSGHGDVERKSLTQPGFLLCWDAPAKIYLSGGTLALPMFQEVISTLSVQNKAKVIVITDACRSGKLSGSAVGGSQLTSNNLAKQYANEIKILSCQPEEYSIEGEQWGGGRGAFSYHLLDGLYGMADSDDDQTISLKEIDRYLEDHVSSEVAPQSQNPMTIGSKVEKLTDVFPELLAQIKDGKKGQMPVFSATESRGIEDDVLEAADSNVVEMYFAFKKALADKQFLFVPKGQAEAGRAENDYAEFYYKKLKDEPSLERLHSSMRRNYAAALQDDAQQVMNDWMKSSQDQALEAETGEKKGRLPKKVFTEKVRAFPACLERAAELLGSDHYMYATLQSRKHFFEGYLLANSDRNPNKELGDKALAQFRQALKWQPELPQAYWQMINVYGFNLLQPDSAEVYAKKAIALYPSWVRPYTDLAFLFSNKYKLFDRSKPYLEKAMQLDSNSLLVLNNWGNYHNSKKEYDEAEKYFKKAIQLDSTYKAAYNNLGIIYENTRRYEEAEKYHKKNIQLDSTDTGSYNNLGVMYNNTRRYEEAEKQYKKAIQLDSTNVLPYNNLGNVYFGTHRYEEAEKYYKKAIQLDSALTHPYNGLGNTYFGSHRYEEAEKYYKKAISLDSTYVNTYNNLGVIYEKTQRYEEAEKYYKKAIQLDSAYGLPYFNLGIVYYLTLRNDEAEKYFEKFIQNDLNKSISSNGIGFTYRIQSEYELAEKYLHQSLQADATIYNPYWNLAWVFYMTDRKEEAYRLLDRGIAAVKSNPDKGDLYHVKGFLNYYAGNIRESISYFQKAEALHSSYCPKGFDAAIEKIANGDIDGAGLLLEKLTKDSPGSDNVKYIYCQLKTGQGDFDGALDLLESANQIGGRTFDFMHTDPKLAPLRELPRYREIMKQYFPGKFMD